jgi:hypothetical protein
MWTNQQERIQLLQELGKLRRRIKRRPHLASDAQAIMFRLRELRHIARVTQNPQAAPTPSTFPRDYA